MNPTITEIAIGNGTVVAPEADVPAARHACSVLLVDDEPAILALLVGQIGREFDVVTACSAEQARSVFAHRTVDIVISDLQLGNESGLQFLDWVRRSAPRAVRVLLTGTARLEDAAEAVNCCQVHRFMLKPWRNEDLLDTLRLAARGLLLERSHEQLLTEYRRLTEELERRVQDRTRELEQTMHQLRMQNQFLEKMALTDSLTGLPNRRSIDLLARKELLRRTRVPGPLALGLIDADRFKDINSAYLLSGGDHVLTWLGQTLQASIRGSDAIGRVGGEEFMVVAPGTDETGAVVLAERLRSNVEEGQAIYKGQEIRVTVSVGFAVVESAGVIGYERLREASAAALADAKAAGRNRSKVKIV
ncbi:MAG TPA: diguanylate cyclase [Fimbriiglobus sp.]